MERLVDRARAAMNLLLVLSIVVLWTSTSVQPSWDVMDLYTKSYGLALEAGVRGSGSEAEKIFLTLPETDEFIAQKLPEARGTLSRAREVLLSLVSGGHDLGILADYPNRVGRVRYDMARSDPDQTVWEFNITRSNPGVSFQPLGGLSTEYESARLFLVFGSCAILVYLFALAMAMKRVLAADPYSLAGIDWILHNPSTLGAALGTLWLLAPAIVLATTAWSHVEFLEFKQTLEIGSVVHGGWPYWFTQLGAVTSPPFILAVAVALYARSSRKEMLRRLKRIASDGIARVSPEA